MYKNFYGYIVKVASNLAGSLTDVIKLIDD